MCSRDDVSPVLKYCVFFFNFVFWFTGIAFIVAGSWAYAEKHRFTAAPTDKAPTYVAVFDVLFDLTILIIILGSVIFIIAFAGCIGALRENICLLKSFSYMLGLLFLIEVILAVLAFVFTGEVKAKVIEVFQNEGLVRYRDDDDLRNLIDWTQSTFGCCGVGLEGYREWSNNAYFNCSAENPSMERCGVPYSCCIKPDEFEESFVNTLCGHQKQELHKAEAQKTIYTSGCVQEILYRVKQNLFIIGGVALAIALIQVLGICLARSLANQIEEYKGS